MVKLIRLELKKHKIGGNILGGFIATFLILGLTVLMFYDDATVTGYGDLFDASNLLTAATFIIFASVLLSKFVIDEFKSKSISVLFMYPISRKKLMLAKMLIVVAFTFLFMVVSNAVIIGGFLLVNHFAHLVQEEFTAGMMFENGIRMLVNAVTASFISLIPLYFGMRKHSVPATIVSSVIIALILNSNGGGDFRLSTVVYVPVAISMIGAYVAYLAIRNIDRKDMI